MIYMFLSNNPSSGDINSSNLPCSRLQPKNEKEIAMTVTNHNLG